MTIPVMLLDVDGVINASRAGWSAAPVSRIVAADGIGWRIRWAPALIGHIRHIITSGAAEVRWCSTWCEHADRLEDLWSLPTLPRCWDTADVTQATALRVASRGVADPRAVYHALKIRAAREVAAEGRPLVWVDDEVVPDPGTTLHADLTGEVPSLLVRPRTRYGLRPDDMDRITAFLSLYRDGGSL